VQHDLASGDRVRGRLRIDEVAGEDIDLVDEFGIDPIEPAAVAARVVTNERANVRATTDEELDEVAADEAARAGDENTAPGPAVRFRCGRHWHA
jgi:hypothetical protein